MDFLSDFRRRHQKVMTNVGGVNFCIKSVTSTFTKSRTEMAYPNMPSLQPLKLLFCWFLIIIPVFKARDPVHSIFWEKYMGIQGIVLTFAFAFEFLKKNYISQKICLGLYYAWLILCMAYIMHESIDEFSRNIEYREKLWTKLLPDFNLHKNLIGRGLRTDSQNRFFIVICQI